ncbi:MAG: hypothetical protein ACRD2X_18400 [Vicinamibacteraceae bacterium]
MNHLNDEQLILFHYGETPEPVSCARHLEACASCRRSYDALRTLLAAGASWEPPPRDALYGERVWTRLEPQIRALQASSSAQVAVSVGADRRPQAGWLGGFGDLFRPRIVALAAYGAALATLIFVLVQSSPRPEEALPPAQSVQVDQARERVLLSSLGDHFDRSQIMLLELTNQEESLDAAGAQAWAQDLLATNRLYRQAAASDGEAAMAGVLDDLERVLLEVAHTPAEPQAQPARFRATRADAREMLFKLRVAGDTVRAREREAFEMPVVFADDAGSK